MNYISQKLAAKKKPHFSLLSCTCTQSRVFIFTKVFSSKKFLYKSSNRKWTAHDSCIFEGRSSLYFCPPICQLRSIFQFFIQQPNKIQSSESARENRVCQRILVSQKRKIHDFSLTKENKNWGISGKKLLFIRQKILTWPLQLHSTKSEY